MKRALFFLVFIIAGVTVRSQSIIDTATVNSGKPHIQIKVNKVYDEDGNIVGYDSTYVWSYSNGTSQIGGSINPDSLFDAFKPWFNNQMNQFSDPFSEHFFNDSTMYLDFFNNEHFFDQWKDELFNFNSEMQRMDSLKRIFFKRYLQEEQHNNKKGIKSY